MNITILTDNKNSWFVRYGKLLEKKLISNGHVVKYVFDKKDILNGNVCFLLSCTKLIEQEYLKLNDNNIVIHASDLPKGKGFSPLQWQILEGKNEIVLTLFEVVEQVDAGPYYLKDKIEFNGTELLEELRSKMAHKIIELSLRYIENYESLKPKEQSGEESFYVRRRTIDDKIDPQETIINLFNHFRIADNERYPLFFEYKGKAYNIKIEQRKK